MEYGFVNDLGIKIANYFTSSEFIELLGTIKAILIIVSIIYILTFIPSLFMIYKKEGIKPWLAFIPIVNLYPLFKLINIPYYLLFIPIVNLIVLYIMPIRMAKSYNCGIILKILSFIFPFVGFILIGFTNKYHLTKLRDIRYLRTVADVDKVEAHLESLSQENFEERGNYQEIPIDGTYRSSVDNMISNIEQNAIQDDFSEVLQQLEDNNEQKKEIKEDVVEDEIIDDVGMQDLFDSSDIRVNKLDQIDSKIEESSKKEIVDNADYKDYKGKDVAVSTIAFGGSEQKVKIEKAKTDSKDSHMKCPKCGAQLIVNNNICPGCGKDVSNIVYENQGLTKVKL